MKLDKKILGNKRKDYLSWDEFFMGLQNFLPEEVKIQIPM